MGDAADAALEYFERQNHFGFGDHGHHGQRRKTRRNRYEYPLGAVVRRLKGWTPMIVMKQCDGGYECRYAGQHPEAGMEDWYDPRNLTLVTNPEEEFRMCNTWRERLTDFEYQTLMSQAGIESQEAEMAQTKTHTTPSMTKMMNLAILAADEAVTSMNVSLPEGKGRYQGSWKFLCPTDLANTLVGAEASDGGDFVLCETQYGLVMGRVVSVDKELDIDENADYQYHWCFARVDTERLDEMKTWQTSVAMQLRTAQKRTVQAKVLEQLGLPADMTLPKLVNASASEV